MTRDGFLSKVATGFSLVGVDGASELESGSRVVARDDDLRWPPYPGTFARLGRTQSILLEELLENGARFSSGIKCGCGSPIRSGMTKWGKTWRTSVRPYMLLK